MPKGKIQNYFLPMDTKHRVCMPLLSGALILTQLGLLQWFPAPAKENSAPECDFYVNLDNKFNIF